MPELPEVETVRRSLWPHVRGMRITQVAVHDGRLRWPVDVAALGQCVAGGRITALRRRSKYLLFDLEAQAPQAGAPPASSVLMVHLGMTGWLGVVPADKARRAHDHADFALSCGRVLRYNDARRFGSLTAFAKNAEADHPLLRHLGPEPLDAAAFAATYLHAHARKTTRRIKTLLMDASCVVGVGNIYANEALFLAGVHPSLPSSRLSYARAEILVAAVRQVLQEAIELGGTTLRDFSNADGIKGLFAPRLRIYNRDAQGCSRCAGEVLKYVLQGRSTYVCRTCQKR